MPLFEEEAREVIPIPFASAYESVLSSALTEEACSSKSHAAAKPRSSRGENLLWIKPRPRGLVLISLPFVQPDRGSAPDLSKALKAHSQFMDFRSQ